MVQGQFKTKTWVSSLFDEFWTQDSCVLQFLYWISVDISRQCCQSTLWPHGHCGQNSFLCEWKRLRCKIMRRNRIGGKIIGRSQHFLKSYRPTWKNQAVQNQNSEWIMVWLSKFYHFLTTRTLVEILPILDGSILYINISHRPLLHGRMAISW